MGIYEIPVILITRLVISNGYTLFETLPADTD